MTGAKSVWAVVPCFNRSVYTLRFLKAFFAQSYPNKYAVVVDDGSSDQTAFNVRCNYPQVHLVEGNGSLWWAGATNLGVKYAIDHGADYILTINDDSRFDAELVMRLVDCAKQNSKYIVGSVLVFASQPDKIWSVGSSTDFAESRLMRLNFAGRNVSELAAVNDPYPVDYMPGNGVLLPVDVFERIGFYDEINFPQYHADSEFIVRATKTGSYIPVISTRAVIQNHIRTDPLVSNLRDLLFNKKSDLYWPAMATFFMRHYPGVDLREIFNKLYSSFSWELVIPNEGP